MTDLLSSPASALFLTLALALPPADKAKILEELRGHLSIMRGYEFYLTYDEIPDKKENWRPTPFIWKGYRVWARKAA